jgi:hypothetical protein
MDPRPTFPVTIGQLSVLHDLDEIPPDRRWEANLVLTWDLPAGHTEEEVWAALAGLAMHHESMRLNYAFGGDGIRMRVAAHDARAATAGVRRPPTDIADIDRARDDLYRTVIDLATDMPWRASVVTENGEPVQVVVVVHQATADGAASLVLQEDLLTLLAGKEPPPAGSVTALSRRQNSPEGTARLRAAQRYWRRTMAAAPRRPLPARSGKYLAATLTTGIPLPRLHDGAEKLQVSLATCVLTAYYRAACRITGGSTQLMLAMSDNRFEVDTIRLVTPLAQYAPMVLGSEPHESFGSTVDKAHWKSFTALKYSICDPIFIGDIMEEYAELDPPAEPGFAYNPMIAPPGFPSDNVARPWSIAHGIPARATGPRIYQIVRGLSSLEIEMRTDHPDFTPETLEAFFASMQEDLQALSGTNEPRHHHSG